MARRPPLAAALTGGPEELEAEFYEALHKGDLDRLMAIWADDDDIVCVQPDGRRAIGSAAVRALFAAGLAGAGGRTVRVEAAHRLTHLGCALHHVVEHLAGTRAAGTDRVPVLATHLYVKSLQGWRLAARHASLGSAEAAGEDAAGPATLH